MSRTTDAIIKTEAGRHETWKKVGTVTVDAGMLWIGDPCRFQPDSHNKHSKWSPAGPWADFCAWLGNADAKQHPLGCVVSSGYGDGIYDVEIRYSHDDGERRIAEVRVPF